MLRLVIPQLRKLFNWPYHGLVWMLLLYRLLINHLPSAFHPLCHTLTKFRCRPDCYDRHLLLPVCLPCISPTHTDTQIDRCTAAGGFMLAGRIWSPASQLSALNSPMAYTFGSFTPQPGLEEWHPNVSLHCPIWALRQHKDVSARFHQSDGQFVCFATGKTLYCLNRDS